MRDRKLAWERINLMVESTDMKKVKIYFTSRYLISDFNSIDSKSRKLMYEKITSKNLPKLNSLSIISGLSGVFSGFNKHIDDISKEYGVDSKLIYVELGKNHVIGGQEDKIIEIASNIKKNEKLFKRKNKNQ